MRNWLRTDVASSHLDSFTGSLFLELQTMSSVVPISDRFILSTDLNLLPTISSFVFLTDPRKVRQRQQFQWLRLVGKSRGRSLEKGAVRRCKEWENQGDWGLEEEILEFMKKSDRPEAFPSKNELVDDGRMDLVEAIVKKGGWLTLGWGLDAEEEVVGGDGHVTHWDSITCKANDDDLFSGNGAAEVCYSEAGEFRGLFQQDFSGLDSASSTGRSIEVGAEDNMGIEDILNGLEKNRNMAFGFGKRERRNGSILSNSNGHNWHSTNSTDADSCSFEKTSRQTSSTYNNGISKDSFSDLYGLGNSHKPEMWRTWAVSRAGFSVKEVEAAEIAYHKARREELSSHGVEVSRDDVLSRLQDMELELTSILEALNSNDEEIVSLSDTRCSDGLWKLSDGWELQEDEVMNAQGVLPSMRAKLALVQGKMVQAIIDAEMMAEEMQKRVGDADKALQQLRTTCIVWSNSASEVLLAGSFDGWAAQRKMEKASRGTFSLCLKLYPGRYEIKFIVDGVWRIDPLRPVVQSGGYENNLLVIL